MSTLRTKFIGDKKFYLHVLAIAIPIMVQNGITNFVGLLDNIMVGQIGTEQMSGVAIVNQLILIYNLCIFGGISGAGIFTAQYFGEGNTLGIQRTFRFKIWIAAAITVIAIGVFVIFGEPLIQNYLNGSSDGGDLSAALHYGRSYLAVILIGLPPFMMLQVYTGTLRECGQTLTPMKAGIVAVIVNLLFNYLLIYGKFGFPQLGVTGAAVATVLSRYVEAGIVICWTHIHKKENNFIEGIYKTLLLPSSLAKRYFMKGLPLLLNETLWSAGMAMLMQCYSVRGLSVIAGLNIANTINNVFNVVYIALGDAVAIIVGQLLGSGKMKAARDTDNKLIVFSVFSCFIIALVMLCVSPLFPQLYNTTDQAKTLAVEFIIVQAIFMPLNAFIHATYFTLRSGGKTIVTFLFDSAFMWCVSVSLAFVLSRFTDIYAVYIFAIVQAADFIKCAIGFVLVKKGVWMRRIVTE